MSETILLGPPPATLAILLDDPDAHDFPALARILDPSWTVGYKLPCSVAKHNAYHLGQIVVLRRLIGAWEERARAPSDS